MRHSLLLWKKFFPDLAHDDVMLVGQHNLHWHSQFIQQVRDFVVDVADAAHFGETVDDGPVGAPW